MEPSEPIERSQSTLLGFLSIQLPPKEAIVDCLIYTNDIASMTGRRREGKTTFGCNLGIAISAPLPAFLNYPIAKARRVAMFLLEDDTRELQDRFQKMASGIDTGDRLHVFTRDHFYERKIPVDGLDPEFQKSVRDLYSQARPEVAIFDNWAHLVGADYNNSKKTHLVMQFLFDLRREFGTAHVIMAHPRKRDSKAAIPKLHESPEAFFEECMGSSHFINTTGSLWGIERDPKSGRTYFVGGNQRLNGSEGTGKAVLELDDNGWFRVVSDFEINLSLAVNTPARERAWAAFPGGEFTYKEARESARLAMSSNGSFNPWWSELRRLALIIDAGEKRFRKAKAKNEAT